MGKYKSDSYRMATVRLLKVIKLIEQELEDGIAISFVESMRNMEYVRELFIEMFDEGFQQGYKQAELDRKIKNN